MDDLFDIRDQINQENQEREDNRSTDRDTDISLHRSISDFGCDEDNPQANEQYIQENQQPQAIINGVGVDFLNEIQQNEKESGLASSISRTRTSVFIPEITEFKRNVSEYKSSSEISEEQFDIINDNYDDSEIIETNIDEEDKEYISSFDLAIEKNMSEQAKISFDDYESRGLELPTIHRKKLKDIVPITEQEQILKGHTDLGEEEDFWDQIYTNERIKFLKIDFNNYLEKLKVNDFKCIRKEIEKKKELTEAEEIILKNIKTKQNRKCKKGETFNVIKNYLGLLDSLSDKLKEIQIQNGVPESIQDLQHQAEQPSTSQYKTNIQITEEEQEVKLFEHK